MPPGATARGAVGACFKGSGKCDVPGVRRTKGPWGHQVILPSHKMALAAGFCEAAVGSNRRIHTARARRRLPGLAKTAYPVRLRSVLRFAAAGRVPLGECR